MSTSLIRSLIILVFLIGLAFRLYQFPAFPEMHADETGFAYSAYSWFKTGVDEYGRPPNLLLESLGDWKLALYGYVTFPLVAMFGLEDWVVRLPSWLLGVATVPVFYVLTKRLFERNDLAIISSVLLWLLPWHIIFSRTGNEVNLELILMLGGIYFFLKWYENKKWWNVVLSGLTFCLSFLSYYPAFVTIPLIALALPIIYLTHTWRDRIVSTLPVVLVVCVMAIFLLSQPTDRISQTSFINSEGPRGILFDRVSESGMANSSVLMTRVLHNKFTVGFAEFFSRYLAHFDWRFLLIDGETGDSRYDVPYQGPLYIWMGAFLLLGSAVALQRMPKQNGKAYVLIWIILLAAMVPGAMTIESVNLQRSFLAVPALVWFVAIGLIEAWKLVQLMPRLYRPAVIGLILCAMFFNLVYFWQNYFVHHQFRRPWGRHGYVSELTKKLQQHAPRFEKIFIADLPYLPMFYYTKTDPVIAQQMLRDESFKQDSATRVKRYGNYENMSTDCPILGKMGVLYACKGDEVPYASHVIDVVRYRDGVPAYTLIELIAMDDSRIKDPKPDRVNIDQATVGMTSITMEEGVYY